MSSSPSISARSQTLTSLGLVIFVLVVSAIRFGPNLARDDIFDGDATHHIYWTYKYADSQLFPNDFAGEYFASKTVVPPGYAALYEVLGKWLDLQIAAELAGAFLFVAALLLAARLARDLRTDNTTVAMWAVVLVLIIAIEELYLLPPMGLQRSFALPLTLWATIALINRQLAQLGVVFLLASLFYPIICATLGVGSAVILGADLIRDRRLPQHWLPLAVLGCSALAIIALRAVPDQVGPMVTKAQALSMPEFGPNGRQKLFGEGIRGFLSYHRTGLGLPLRWLAATGTILLVLLWRKRLTKIPVEIWVLTVTALLVWAAARAMLFVLYLPNRHTAWVLPIFVAVAVAVLATELVRHYPEKVTRLGLGVVIIAVLFYHGEKAWEKTQSPINDDLEQAYEYLRNMPKDTLVAAHPLDADLVPMRARRSVLVSRETSISFMLGYYRRASERIYASLDAAYASDWQTIDYLADEWGVDIFLVTPTAWVMTGYDEPFDGYVKDLIDVGQAKGFVLKNPSTERILFKRGDIMLVRVGSSESHPK